MQSFCLMLARFCIAAWVGAAVLFVITGVREVTIPHQSISSEVKDALVPIRFPAYYMAGFLLVGTGIVTSGIASKHPSVTTKRMRVCLGLLILESARLLAILEQPLSHIHFESRPPIRPFGIRRVERQPGLQEK